jgi:hypothetical protein
MTDYDDLAERSETGQVSEAELAMLRAELAAEPFGPNRHRMLYILGNSFDTSAKKLVERYLVCPQDSMMSWLALQILGTFWGLAGDYRDYVIEYVRGVNWDMEEGGFVRHMALSVAGTHLRDNRDPEMLRELLAVADDPGDEFGEWDMLTFEIAVEFLGRALGYEWPELLAAPGGFKPDSPITKEILTKARQRLGDETTP